MSNKILYAEDEPDIREIAVLAMETLGGFQVATCDSGATVVETAASFQPNLILLDVMMPGVDGPSALKELRQNAEFNDIPVVFMTAKALASEIQDLIDLGAVEVITKPFDPMSLPEKLKEIISKNSG